MQSLKPGELYQFPLPKRFWLFENEKTFKIIKAKIIPFIYLNRKWHYDHYRYIFITKYGKIIFTPDISGIKLMKNY